MLATSVSQENVAMKRWRRVLKRSVGEEFRREVLEKSVLEKYWSNVPKVL